VCKPQCDGKICGDDGCGGTCAPGCTGDGARCLAEGTKCEVCTPQCDGKSCGGDDGCGGPCGCDAAKGEVCSLGKCEVCVKRCDGRTCGPDGCGGTCGTCLNDATCDEATGLCAGCTRNCDGKTCGPDGCGGVCGTCLAGTCNDTTGKGDGCEPQCGPNKTCGPDGCGGSCGTCDANQQCGSEGTCIDANSLVACVPQTISAADKYDPAAPCDGTKWCLYKAQIICARKVACCQIANGMLDDCLAREQAVCNETDLTARLTAGITAIATVSPKDYSKQCLDWEAAYLDCAATDDFRYWACSDGLVFPSNPAPVKRDNIPVCFGYKDCGYHPNRDHYYRCDREMGKCGADGTGGLCRDGIPAGTETCNLNDLACDKNLYCKIDAGSTGTCVAKVPAGGDCSSYFQCASGFCYQGKCKDTIRQPNNQPPPACGFADQCQYDRCGGPPTGGGDSGTCIKAFTATAGQLCRSYLDGLYGSGEECDYRSTYCEGASATSFGVCTAFKAVGEACVGDYQCGPTAACGGAPTKKCVARGDNGAPCASVRECKWGLSCSEGRCRGLAEVGGSCFGDYDCKRYLRCDQNSKTCVAEVSGEGGPCSHDLHCGEQMYCTANNVCAPLIAAGGVCRNTAYDWDDACVSGDCERAGADYVCREMCNFTPGK